ncbi:MAG: LVIVD repeat-containing protein [Candidatus Dormibacteria bacterium]
MHGFKTRATLVALIGILGTQVATAARGHAATVTGTSSNFTLVGHNSLFDRGENAAMANYDHYMYIGSRSDGTHLHSGVEVVDIADPSNPVVVNEIPIPTEMSAGYTSRELRVWPQQKVLMVLYFGCSALIHSCVSGSDTGEQPLTRINFFDLSTNPANPVLTSTYTPPVTPHEMFLWADPQNVNRALLYWTSPNSTLMQLVVTDLSQWKTGAFTNLAAFAKPSFQGVNTSGLDIRLHSLSVSADGTRAYLAYLGGGVIILDTSQFASGAAQPKFTQITPVTGRGQWPDPTGELAHSSVYIPGKQYILTTEELYGKGTPAMSAAFGPAFAGCPWGWVHIVDMSDPSNLKVVSEFKIDENNLTSCPALQDNFSAYTSHNPTVLPDIAFITWHSGGLRAVDLTDPTNPAQDGYFVPTPEPVTAGHTDDPALEPGSNGTIAWSYPIIRNGLIYYIDIANGLYVVKYTGAHADEVNAVSFLEGNSNLGDAARLAASTLAASTPEAPMPLLLPAIALALVATMFGIGRRRRRVDRS